MPHHIPSYASRTNAMHGIYHSIHNLLQNDSHSLTRISPNKDLNSYDSNPWGTNNNITTWFHFTGHREEAVVHLIGETLGAENGTTLGALGGTVKKPNLVFPFSVLHLMLSNLFKIQDINDSTTVRDVIVLDLPTMVTAEITKVYDHQIQTLNALYKKDLHEVGNLCFYDACILRQYALGAREKEGLGHQLSCQCRGKGNMCCTSSQISGLPSIIMIAHSV